MEKSIRKRDDFVVDVLFYIVCRDLGTRVLCSVLGFQLLCEQGSFSETGDEIFVFFCVKFR